MIIGALTTQQPYISDTDAGIAMAKDIECSRWAMDAYVYTCVDSVYREQQRNCVVVQ